MENQVKVVLEIVKTSRGTSSKAFKEKELILYRGYF
jgi:hypothetical protein